MPDGRIFMNHGTVPVHRCPVHSRNTRRSADEFGRAVRQGAECGQWIAWDEAEATWCEGERYLDGSRGGKKGSEALHPAPHHAQTTPNGPRCRRTSADSGCFARLRAAEETKNKTTSMLREVDGGTSYKIYI